MSTRIHTIAALVLVAYSGLVLVNVQPLAKSDHVSVNWNLLGISVLGFLIATGYVIASVIVRKRMSVTGIHAAVLLIESAIVAGIAGTCLFRSLTFFGVV